MRACSPAPPTLRCVALSSSKWALLGVLRCVVLAARLADRTARAGGWAVLQGKGNITEHRHTLHQRFLSSQIQPVFPTICMPVSARQLQKPSFHTELRSAGAALGGVLGGAVGDWAAARNADHGRIFACQFSVSMGIPFTLLLLKGLPRLASQASVLMYTGTLFTFGLVHVWAAPACNNPVFAEIVPVPMRNLVYAFDRCGSSLMLCLRLSLTLCLCPSLTLCLCLCLSLTLWLCRCRCATVCLCRCRCATLSTPTPGAAAAALGSPASFPQPNPRSLPCTPHSSVTH